MEVTASGKKFYISQGDLRRRELSQSNEAGELKRGVKVKNRQRYFYDAEPSSPWCA
jgi:hypothetical protein